VDELTCVPMLVVTENWRNSGTSYAGSNALRSLLTGTCTSTAMLRRTEGDGY